MSFEENCVKENTCPSQNNHIWSLPDSDRMVDCINCGQCRNGGYIYLKNNSPLFIQKSLNCFPFEFSSIHATRTQALMEAELYGFKLNDLITVMVIDHYTSKESPTENRFYIPDWNTARPYLTES